MAYRNLLNRATHYRCGFAVMKQENFSQTPACFTLFHRLNRPFFIMKSCQKNLPNVSPRLGKKKKKAIANGSMKKSASMPFFGQSRRCWRTQRQNEGSFQASLAKCSCRIRQARRCKWNKLPVWEALNAPVHHFGVCFTFGASLPFLLSSLTTTGGILLQPFLSRGTAALAEN